MATKEERVARVRAGFLRSLAVHVERDPDLATWAEARATELNAATTLQELEDVALIPPAVVAAARRAH